MKRKFYSVLLFAIIFFLAFNSGSAQTVTIGTGTELGNHPIYPFYGYTYSQSIYYQSEIGIPGTITAIKFYYAGGANTDAIRVYIGHTTKTTFSSTTDWVPVASMTSVYNANYSYGAATGWYQITLSTPFVYNNTDNLVIAVDENTAGYHSSSDDFYNTNVTGNRSLYYYSDATNPNPTIPPAGTLTSKIANVQLVITPAAACTPAFVPGTASATPATICVGESTTLTLTGTTAASGLTYQWQSAPAVGGPFTNITGATSSTYVATPTSNTWYQCVVTCSSGPTSKTSNVVSVGVSCLVIGGGTTNSFNYPYSGDYNDGRSQFIITAAELTAMGLCSGTVLSSLSFNVSSKNSTKSYTGLTIRLSHTATSSFASATFLAPGAINYGPTNYTTALGWNTHTFTSNFTWNGTDNILVNICFNGNNTAGTNSDAVYCTTTAGTTVCYDYTNSGGSNGCALTGQATSNIRPNMKFNYTPGSGCSTVTGGTAAATPGSVCFGNTTTLSLSGHTVACGTTYQWQSSSALGGPYTNIPGATTQTYVVSPVATTYYQCVVTCPSTSSTATSSRVTVTMTSAPTYATLPYNMSFETNWVSTCDTRDRPDASWTNSPSTGNNSWRRDDNGATAAWTNVATGIYSPVSTLGSHSARFHACETSGSGNLDLYINLGAAGTKSLCFDYILSSSSSAGMTVLLSTDGGATFPTTLLSLTTANTWTYYTTTITATSTTCVIRFKANGDDGSYDIGLDNLSVMLLTAPNSAVYTSPSNGATGIVCGDDAILNWTSGGPACSPPTSYDVYFGTAAIPPFVINQTSTTYNPGTLLPSTTYYWQIIPKNSIGSATGCPIYSFTTGATYAPAQSTPPITDGFESCFNWTVVNGTQPNKWIRGTATANTGTYSMYINNTGTNNDYTITSSSIVHFYKEITFPVGAFDYNLSFYWKGVGESCCDYLTVYLAPKTYTPVAGTTVTDYVYMSPTYKGSSTYQYVSTTLPIACNGNEVYRLIFSWKNDGSVGTQPPGSIDDIAITRTPRVGNTCANPVNVTLPYSKTGETTDCMGNEYTNASPGSCGSNYESGNDKVYKVLVGAAGCLNVTLSNCSSTSIGLQVYKDCPDVSTGSCIYYSTSGAVGGTLSQDITFPAPGYYYFIVDNWAAPDHVHYDISIGAPGGAVANDRVCEAVNLTLGISATGDNSCTGAGLEPAKPACWTTGAMNTVWFRVTVPASRSLAIKTTAGTLLKTQIDVYRGNDCNALTYVDCNDNAPSCGGSSYSNSYLLVTIPAGSTYAYIRVDGEDDLVGNFSILVTDGTVPLPPIVGQDCGAAGTATNLICDQTVSINNPGYFAYGNICDFNGTNMCLASGERSSTWYTINTNASGFLEFDIVPNDYGNPNPLTGQINPGYTAVGDETDYDWALWKWEPTCDGLGDLTFCCADISANTDPATSCNYNYLGVTGLYGTANYIAPAAYPGFDAAYMQRLAVNAGEIYVLCITNFADDYVSGFTLKFSTTSPIGYATPGATLVWNSSTSNVWSQPGNWGGCSAPSCLLNAQINAGGAQPVLFADASVKDLVINAGATLTINAGVTLTICGNFTNNGNLVMAANSTLLFNNGSVNQSINGSLTGTNKIGGLTINKSGGSVSLSADIDIGGNFTTSNVNSIFDANNHVVKVGGNFNSASPATLVDFPNIEFNGTVPQTYTNGVIALVWTNVTMNNTGGGLILSAGSTSNLYISGVLNLINGIIYSGAPPYVIMNAGSSVTGGSSASFIDGYMRKIGNTAFVFPLGDAFNRYMPLGISAPAASSTFTARYYYSTYSNTSSMAVTPLPVLFNVSLNEYWTLDRLAGGSNVSVTLYWTDAASSGIDNCLPLPAGDLTVARWNGSAWENSSSTITGGITGTCVGASSGSVTSDVITSFSPFTFGSKAPIINPLPVRLLSFSGKTTGNENILEWVTATEVNNDFFTIQRSTDGFTFKDISVIDGGGNSNQIINYKYIDKNFDFGKNYYRLKQTDFNGIVRYAPNLVVFDKNQNPSFKLYPNPATNDVTITTANYNDEELTLVFKDVTGNNILKKKTVTLDKNNNTATISIKDLAPGIYLINILDMDNNPIAFQKLVKLQ